MKTADIRQSFIEFFESKGHSPVKSSSLVPGNDLTLLFTNAGMVQFKDVFLGQEKRPYSRATSSQRCVRAGGKHNDLENVGYTARHHTFFEMLGNFSFGDYFKKEAIAFAWEYLTQVLRLPEEKLWITVHVSDDEAADIWLKDMGVSAERFSRLDEDNFWQMGDTGPCGPSSEIFYDHGEDVAGGPPGSPDDDGDRYIEVWNLVFMQFERNAAGELKPLPNPSIDTGMGLERIAAVMQGVHNNYDIDLFAHLVGAAAKLLNQSDLSNTSLRVIADHIRSCSFLIADGVLPSNEGRGYVLRRIIRRAVRHGNSLGAEGHFFHRLVAPLVEQMGEAFPELREQQTQIEKALEQEEAQFARTLDQGLRILEQDLEQLSGTEIPGATVFRLYDTYGFPVDLTADIARERGLTIDQAGFESEMEAQRERARGAGQFKAGHYENLPTEATEFLGYSDLNAQVSVLALYDENLASQNRIEAGQDVSLVLDKTPFYGESGGQVGDSGYLLADGLRIEVRDTQRQGDIFIHSARIVEGSVAVGDSLRAEVDNTLRERIKRNHSATHLLHAALRTVLGEHVSQKGSLVDADKLRFDFAHPQAVSAQELADITALVNQQILANTAVQTEVTDMENAQKLGAMMLFGEKYGDTVRVLSMGDGFSVELCGGTHVQRTGDIGLFHIASESGISSGVRRIEALTGDHALKHLQSQERQLQLIAAELKVRSSELPKRLSQMQQQQKQLERELAAAKQKLATGGGGDLLSQAQTVGDVKVLAVKLDGIDAKTLRSTMDQLKDRMGSGVLLLASAEGDKVNLVAGVTKDLCDRFKAGDLMRLAAATVGGKGGGRPDMAQGGGTDVSAIEQALEQALSYVKENA